MKRFLNIFSSEKAGWKNYVYSNCMFIAISGREVEKRQSKEWRQEARNEGEVLIVVDFFV